MTCNTPNSAQAARPRAGANSPGRPLIYSVDEMQAMAAQAPGLSRQSIQMRITAARAAAVLRGDDGKPEAAYAWLLKPDGSALRLSLLAELGRLKQREAIRAAALLVCEEEPTARMGVARLRMKRRPEEVPSAEGRELAQEIIDTLNWYGARRKYLGPRVMREAIALVTAGIDRAEAETLKTQQQQKKQNTPTAAPRGRNEHR